MSDAEQQRARELVTDDKGELKFAALAPDVKKSDKLSKPDLTKLVHLNNTTEDAGETRYLLAYDDNAEGELAFKYALRNAKEGDHVFIVQVLEINKTELAYLDEHAVLEKMNNAVVDTLSQRAEPFHAKGVLVSVHVAHGEPKAAILAMADFHKCDAILLGRRKLGRFQKLISSSSVSQWVLTHANQTVTIVKS